MQLETALYDEPARLAALDRLAILDTAPEEPFENVVALVRSVLGVPMAAVTLIDEDRQWFKARAGIGDVQTARSVSFCTHTIMQREPLVVNDATLDARFAGNPFVIDDPRIRSYAGVPLCTPDGYNVGALCAVDVQPRTFSDMEVAILRNLARIVINELELRRIAGRDQLTGVHTRRGFIEKAEQEIARFDRYGRSAALLLIDVDHFKAVNDTYGHPTGDRVLRQLAATLTEAKRPSDALGRLGGEEFAILLPETEAQSALAAAERFRQAIAGKAVELPAGNQPPEVTVSIGVAPLVPGIDNAEEWIAAADAPLYQAKRTGRNRSILA